MKRARSRYSGLRCLVCGGKVLTGPEHGALFGAVLDANGSVVEETAVCGDCRREQVGNAVAQSAEAA